ncbi:iron-containing alcohol dehydrogenase [Deferribacter autotrophicus]|uniref:Iron-containing alcohol dehydrogenase n=1 Tax=Deferribacter autotrophicus TaxID=500465 RepID=A0A5A8EZD5_9BACT|nr:iron-containing alcohol dehydrogenase [Deferribacter autotrophicus]KAA0256853.1 iron-containing alcohol dehydrogenase [Deferribacter autotrophicus]
MKEFSFQTVKNLIFGVNSLTKLNDLASEYGIKKFLIVTDKGLIENELVDNVEKVLIEGGLDYCIFSEVVADPPEEIVLRAVDTAKKESVDGIIGFGGGSSMDVAKLVSFLSISEQNLENIYGVDKAKGERLPLIQIPTTAGTGSEVTPIAIVTTGINEKKGVVSKILYADVALLDPILTLNLPPKITAMTGIDAMVHAIESYTSKYKKNKISDAFAKEALNLLGTNIEKAVFTGSDVEARSNMLLGATIAGISFANSPVAAVHALAYPIGGHFHVPHGLSNSLVLPHVMRFNLPLASKYYAELARVTFPNIDFKGSNEEIAEKYIEELEGLIKKLNLPTKLREVGVGESDLEMMAEDAMKQERLLVNNPRELKKEDAYSIYKAAF